MNSNARSEIDIQAIAKKYRIPKKQVARFAADVRGFLDTYTQIGARTDAPKTVRLPRDGENKIMPRFTIAGRTFYILDPAEGIGIQRSTMFERSLVSLGFGRSFSSLFDTLQEADLAMYGEIPMIERFQKTSLLIRSMMTSIVEFGEERFSLAFYIATLFVVEDNEDLTTWEKPKAEEKIQFWNDQNLSEPDFFFLTANFIGGFRKRYKEVKAKEDLLRADISDYLK